MNFGVNALSGFIFGCGLILAAFVCKALLHISFCN